MDVKTQADDARQVNQVSPPPRLVERNLYYEALPWETHPIDLAYGSQGWGPFHGPWTPEDFVSPFWGIDITWAAGDNATTFSPPWQITTLMEDPSTDYVANSSLLATLERAVSAGAQRFTSTISNGTQVTTPQSGAGAGSSRWAKALSALGLGAGT
jgi:hypothetical protein